MPNLSTCDVLVVEDDPAAVQLLEQAFEKAGLMAPLHIVRNDDEAKAYLGGTSLIAANSLFQ